MFQALDAPTLPNIPPPNSSSFLLLLRIFSLLYIVALFPFSKNRGTKLLRLQLASLLHTNAADQVI